MEICDNAGFAIKPRLNGKTWFCGKAGIYGN